MGYESEDCNELIRINKSKKDKQYNGQKKKDKSTNNDLKHNTQKTKDRVTPIPLKKTRSELYVFWKGKQFGPTSDIRVQLERHGLTWIVVSVFSP